MNITSDDYKKLLDNVKSKKEKTKSAAITKRKTSKSKADYKDRIWRILNKLCDGWRTEVKFHPKRKWRFDWANEELMVAVEYEGIFGGKSRHTNLTGFTNDCEKYNNAQIIGWKVLRYTAANYEQIQKDIEAILKDKK
jgi:hypothetical protein